MDRVTYRVWLRAEPRPCDHWSDYIDYAFDDEQDGIDYQLAVYGERGRYDLTRRREAMPTVLRAWPPPPEVAADIELLKRGFTLQQVELIHQGAPVDWMESWIA